MLKDEKITKKKMDAACLTNAAYLIRGTQGSSFQALTKKENVNNFPQPQDVL